MSAIRDNNPVTGQSQSGLWFGKTDDLWSFGKPQGWGGVWRQDQVKANQASDPYLMTGFDQKVMFEMKSGILTRVCTNSPVVPATSMTEKLYTHACKTGVIIWNLHQIKNRRCSRRRVFHVSSAACACGKVYCTFCKWQKLILCRYLMYC